MATSDPLADFLAREKDEFAVLDDEDAFGRVDELSHPTSQLNGFSDTNGHANLNGDEQDFFGVQNDDNISTTNADVTSFDSLPVASDLRPQSAVTPPVAIPVMPRIEPEKIRKWRDEQKTRLENKDAQEEKEKERLRQQARKELEDWYKIRDEQLEKTKNSNKSAEQEFVRERDVDLPGQEWERIARLCEFNPKASKNAKDVSRMRTLLLQMKSAKSN
uniref:Clathrin light chain n=1 Tax=Romanomermis culicivorax TaxID=13658 RepID=A0A915K3Q1_ROMCU